MNAEASAEGFLACIVGAVFLAANAKGERTRYTRDVFNAPRPILIPSALYLLAHIANNGGVAACSVLMRMCMYMYVCMYVYVCVCVFVCVCL
jgi:hypothetical protein